MQDFFYYIIKKLYSYDIEKGCCVDFFVMDTNIDRMDKKEQDTQLKYLIDMIKILFVIFYTYPKPQIL